MSDSGGKGGGRRDEQREQGGRKDRKDRRPERGERVEAGRGTTVADDAPRTPGGRSPAPKRLDVSATPGTPKGLEQMPQEFCAGYGLQAPATGTMGVVEGAAGGGGVAAGGGVMAAPMQMMQQVRRDRRCDARRARSRREGLMLHAHVEHAPKGRARLCPRGVRPCLERAETCASKVLGGVFGSWMTRGAQRRSMRRTAVVIRGPSGNPSSAEACPMWRAHREWG